MSKNTDKIGVLIIGGGGLLSEDLENRLTGLGYAICGNAASGDKALEICEQSQPDLIIVDINLRGEIDSIDTAKIAHEKWGVPVVFLLADEDAGRLERARLNCPFWYLLKPIRDKDLKVAAEMARQASLSDADRGKVERALKASEEQYRLLVESTGDIVFTHDENGVITFANNRGLEFAGYTLEEVRGKNVLEFLPPDELEALFKRRDSRHAGDGLHYQYETAFINRFNQRIDVDIHSTPIFSNGVFLGEIIVARDITGRRQAEAALRESERMYRLLADNQADVVWTRDLDFRLTYISPSIVRQSGFSVDEKMVQTLEESMTGDSAARSVRILSEEIAREAEGNADPARSRTFELEMYHKDGTTFPVETTVSFLRDETGKAVSIIGINRDITERKQAEKALLRSARELQEAQEMAHLGYWYWDVHTGDVEWSDEVYRIFRLNPAEFTPHIDSILELSPFPGDRERNEELIKRATENHERGSYEQKFLRPDGSIGYYLSSFEGIYDEGGQLIAIRGIVLDITERKEAEKEKERLQTQLMHAQKLEAIGTLAGGISHDFNNILQAIQGYTQMLLLDKSPDDPEFSSLEAIRNTSDRAAQLVKQLLFFSRKAETERKPLNLNKEILHARVILERTIPKMIEIETYLDDDLWTVNADPVQIEQILLNLGINAAQAMPEGGRLIIETHNIVIDDDYVQNHIEASGGKYVSLTVSDTGIGISKETVEHIFEPFFTTKEIGRGTGLGLASVYGIVKSHGGLINCYSEEGQGAVFKVYLPVMAEAGERAVVSDENQIVVGGTETIMVVDDEEHIRDLATQILERFDYRVLIATSGEEAIEQYLKDPADLIILDLGMPGMGGHKCLRNLLKINPSIKILIASGYTINGQVKDILKSGAKGFIAKPYQLRDLLAKVRAVLDES